MAPEPEAAADLDVLLAIASKRDLRGYLPDPVEPEVLRQVLDAGRLAGSGRNRQGRRFVVLGEETRARAAECVTRPSNLIGAPHAVAIAVGDSSFALFDAGRAAQNMMLAAWSRGVVSCPNAIADPAALAQLLELGEEERVGVILTLGYPLRARPPHSRSAAEWSQVADRLPLEQAVEERR